MIQRVQSIFLLIAVIIPIVLIFIPLGYVDTDLARYVYNSISLKEMVPDGANSVLRLYYVAFCLFLTAGLAGISIFMYKNRVKQMQLVSLTMIVFLITLMLMLWVCPDIVFKKFFNGKTEGYTFTFNMVPLIIMIVVEAVCLFLANRFIKKDEELVRSADRLR
ncbi:MAG: DUF4293 domain-containing protein [Bacteroidales bacterium]|nr:DUF4293 domain-containing protein [Bacteroidales bacterium]